ncbi:hypothetical protein JYT51_01695, partial [Candidatus Amoebophilus asiaticus]|nr:hypothetical protein [Candidatus Amoebophilus asiaticus]
MQSAVKHLSLTVLVATALIWIVFFQNHEKVVPVYQVDKENTSTFPFDAVKFELLKKADPKTGKIPLDGRWKAYKQLKAEGKIQSSKYKTGNEPIRQWYPIDDYFNTLSITRIAYDPNNTKTFYFCTGEGWWNADAVQGAGVWKSTDGGETWNQITSTDTSIFYQCQDMKVHPMTSDIYVATRRGGLQRSGDGGNTWVMVLGKGQGSLVNSSADIEFTQNGGIFVTMGFGYNESFTQNESDGIYYSDNGDSGTFSKQTNGFPTSQISRIELATAPSNDSIAYAIPLNYVDDSIQGVYKTTDKGNTWFEVAKPGGDRQLARVQGWYDLTIAVDPNDENVVVAGGLNLWKSLDGGNSWIKLSHGSHRDTIGFQYVHVDQHEIMFISSDTVYFGNDGGIWKCDNFTDSVPVLYDRNFTYNVTQYYAGAIHGDSGNYTIIGGTQDNGSSMATGNGISDFQKLTGADGSFCAINHLNGNIMYTTTQYRRMYRFTEGGFGKYDTITNPNITNFNTLFINPMEIDPNDPEIIYQPTKRGLWRMKNASTADTSGWEKACKNWSTLSAIGISKSQPNTVFLGRSGGGNIYRIENADSTDATYTPIDCDPDQNLPSAYCSCVYVDINDVNHVIVTYSNYGEKSIFESKNATDASPSWQNVEGDLPDIPVNWALLHPVNPEVCYVATEMGVFYTKKLDGDSTVWLPSNQGLANVRTDMIKMRMSDFAVLAATHGRGLFTGRIDTSATSYEIIWTERGPANVGGRTRTIMVDPND